MSLVHGKSGIELQARCRGTGGGHAPEAETRGGFGDVADPRPLLGFDHRQDAVSDHRQVQLDGVGRCAGERRAPGLGQPVGLELAAIEHPATVGREVEVGYREGRPVGREPVKRRAVPADGVDRFRAGVLDVADEGHPFAARVDLPPGAHVGPRLTGGRELSPGVVRWQRELGVGGSGSEEEQHRERQRHTCNAKLRTQGKWSAHAQKNAKGWQEATADSGCVRAGRPRRRSRPLRSRRPAGAGRR